jgi:hypothetical protein
MTKLPLIFYEKDLGVVLSFVYETSRGPCFLWLASQSCVLCRTKLNARIALFWYVGGKTLENPITIGRRLLRNVQDYWYVRHPELKLRSSE